MTAGDPFLLHSAGRWAGRSVGFLTRKCEPDVQPQDVAVVHWEAVLPHGLGSGTWPRLTPLRQLARHHWWDALTSAGDPFLRLTAGRRAGRTVGFLAMGAPTRIDALLASKKRIGDREAFALWASRLRGSTPVNGYTLKALRRLTIGALFD